MIATAGGVRSGLLTVTVTGLAVAVLPAASRATAVRVWAPLATVVVSHANEYGALVRSAPRFPPSSWNWTPTTPTLSAAVADVVTVPVTVVPEIGAVIDAVGGTRSMPSVSSWDGTLTMKASSREPSRLLVHMKYCPVTSRLPLGYFEYLAPPPDAFMSVITGATTSTRNEPSRRKQTISLTRGPLRALEPLPHTYCCSGGTPAIALAWLMWSMLGGIHWGS